jgi:PAS domain-containing protein
MNVLPASTTAPDLTGRWWKHLFEASTDAQVVCRSDGVVDQINPKASRLFHLDRARDEGSFSVFKIVSRPADVKLAALLARGLTRADNLHSVRIPRAGGLHSFVDLELVPLG